MYSIGVAAMLLGVCIKTLRRWDSVEKIRCVRALGGHKRFPISELKRILEGKMAGQEDSELKINI